MSKLATIALLCLGLLIAGCGGEDGEEGSTSTATTATPTTTEGEAEPKGATAKEKEAEAKPKSALAAKEAAKVKDAGAEKTPPGAKPADPEEFIAPKGGDDSIQTYGELAADEQTEEIILAMRTFFAALAGLDYPAICEGLTKANRESLQMFLKAKDEEGGCEEVLTKLYLPRIAPEARKAANGSVLEARTEDGNAFVLFTPEGGVPSYFVMKDEGGSWKATGLSPGAPFDPTAAG